MITLSNLGFLTGHSKPCGFPIHPESTGCYPASVDELIGIIHKLYPNVSVDHIDVLGEEFDNEGNITRKVVKLKTKGTFRDENKTVETEGFWESIRGEVTRQLQTNDNGQEEGGFTRPEIADQTGERRIRAFNYMGNGTWDIRW